MEPETISALVMILGPAASFWLGLWWGKRERRADDYNEGYKDACDDINTAQNWVELNRINSENWLAHDAGYPNDYENIAKRHESVQNKRRNYQGGTSYHRMN